MSKQSEGDERPSLEAQESVEAGANDMEQLRRDILSSDPAIVIANHCFGLFELAAIYLSDSPPRLKEATLAIDALSGLLHAVPGRLGTREPEIKEGLSQLRLAFIQFSMANVAKDEPPAV